MKAMPQLVINGLIAGGTYALVAIGYSMVFGVLGFSNWAHGVVSMVGAYVNFLLYSRVGMSLPFALVLSMGTTAILGVTINKLAYKPLRNAPRINLFISSLCVSIIIQAVVVLLVGASYERFVLPAGLVGGRRLGPAFITPVQITIIVTSVFLMLCLQLVLSKTRIGKAMRAVADNPVLASVNGLNTDNIISLVFAVGSALAAVAGSLYAMDTCISPILGMEIGIKGFASVVLGGLGQVNGAILGGFILGIAENLGVWVVAGGDARWKLTIAYLITVLIFLVRPTGLLGSREK